MSGWCATISTVPKPPPPVFEELPGTGLCRCGAAYYFEHGNGANVPGHFLCHRCGRRYSLGLKWTPGAPTEPDDRKPDSDGSLSESKALPRNPGKQSR